MFIVPFGYVSSKHFISLCDNVCYLFFDIFYHLWLYSCEFSFIRLEENFPQYRLMLFWGFLWFGKFLNNRGKLIETFIWKPGLLIFLIILKDKLSYFGYIFGFQAAKTEQFFKWFDKHSRRKIIEKHVFVSVNKFLPQNMHFNICLHSEMKIKTHPIPYLFTFLFQFFFLSKLTNPFLRLINKLFKNYHSIEKLKIILIWMPISDRKLNNIWKLKKRFFRFWKIVELAFLVNENFTFFTNSWLLRNMRNFSSFSNY